MHLTPVPDLGLPGYALIGGAILAAVLFLIVWLLEASLLRRVMRGAHALRDSFIMNLVTTVLGVALLGVGSVLGVPGWAALLIDWAASIVIEALILRLLERSSPYRAALRASAVVNTASYALLLIAWMLLSLNAA